MQPVERVRGMLDALPADAAKLHELSAAMCEHFARFGYRPAQVPIIEFAELFLRKSGADVNARLYAFTDQGGRRLALRPELTAPALRAFLQQPEPPPLPARLSYAGPVFRYEKPQRGRYRQFTQVGVELIGAEPPFADAELLSMTAAVPKLLDLGPTRMVIGHLGVVLAFLAAMEVDGRTQVLLLQGLEMLKKEDESADVLRRLLLQGSTANGVAIDALAAPADGPTPDPRLRTILSTLDRGDAILLVRSLLGSINTDVGGGREPEEIVDRLLERLRTGDQRAKAERAIEFILELGRIAGPRDTALSQARALLDRYDLPGQPLQELESICQALDSVGFDWSSATIDLSLGRGLQYYTGLVFELYGSGLGAEDQICGGGRYDGLARALGAKQDVPAIGCSFGLERLKLLRDEHASTASKNWLDALVVPVGDTYAYAVEVADALRAHGAYVELEVRRRNLRASLAYGEKQAVPWVLVVGEKERAEATVTVRYVPTRTATPVRLLTLRERGLEGLERVTP